MLLEVLSEISLLHELLFSHGALVRLHIFVHPHVVEKVSRLREGLITLAVLAHVSNRRLLKDFVSVNESLVPIRHEQLHVFVIF